jgi:glycosyltransferase involved in cell wall biosynthesis
MSLTSEICNEGELVIVLNGDAARKGLSSWKEIATDCHELLSKAKVVTSYANGLSSALSVGLNECCGEYVVRIDSDDRVVKGRIENQVHYLEMNPEVHVLAGRANLINSDSKYLDKILGLPCDKYWCSFLLKIHCVPIHPSVCFRREQILEVGGYSLGGFAEDYDLWMRVERSYRNSIVVLSDIVIDYRVHHTQVTKSTNLFLKEHYRKYVQIREILVTPRVSSLLLLFVPRRIAFSIYKLLRRA